jgi:hypothetical protein
MAFKIATLFWAEAKEAIVRDIAENELSLVT